LLALAAGRGTARANEVNLSADRLKKLDTFEAHTLAKADQAFGKKAWRQAAALYDSFMIQFPRSPVIPYCLVRKGRALQHDGKRFKAIEEYTEVLDYYPNAIGFAAPALYYTGACHWSNGDIAKAMKAWAEMANDKDYCKHPLAAPAINRLAGNLMERKEYEEAVKYYRQVAVDFRSANGAAACEAMGPIVHYYIRTHPDEPELRAFYHAVRGFGSRPIDVPDDLNKDRTYWKMLWGEVWNRGKFPNLQQKQEADYYTYWADAFKGRFPDWDDYQITSAALRLRADGNVKTWIAHLDRQFKEHQKPDDFNRVIRWISLYRSYPKKVDEYYRKLRFEKMDNPTIYHLMQVAFDSIRNPELGRNTFGKLGFEDMPDENAKGLDKGEIAAYLQRKDAALVKEVYLRYTDRMLGKFRLMQFCYARKDAKEGLPLANELVKAPKFAKEAWWVKAEFLAMRKKYAEAIAAYKMCQNEPKNLWKIVDCLVALGKASQAIQQLTEIEHFFKNDASAAALRIADVYHGTGDQTKYIASLRRVLKKYPKSSQSRTAHVRLEKMGVRTGGGVDAE